MYRKDWKKQHLRKVGRVRKDRKRITRPLTHGAIHVDFRVVGITIVRNSLYVSVRSLDRAFVIFGKEDTSLKLSSWSELLCLFVLLDCTLPFVARLLRCMIAVVSLIVSQQHTMLRSSNGRSTLLLLTQKNVRQRLLLPKRNRAIYSRLSLSPSPPSPLARLALACALCFACPFPTKEKAPAGCRTETDSMGPLYVGHSRYFGAQTVRHAQLAKPIPLCGRLFNLERRVEGRI